ncbi:hypothetical protein [Streptomyces sp. NPDC056154]|uniref:hypothetical protein n=1 Tax=unclassified Streptomyces TaxID=2593676 RepID=UPI0035E3B129
MNEIEIDRAIERVFADNEERRSLYGAFLAETEERLERAEEDALTAYEGYAEIGAVKDSGIGPLLAKLERVRAEVNELREPGLEREANESELLWRAPFERRSH